MPKYDRELIARMLLGPRVYSPESVAEQARLLREGLDPESVEMLPIYRAMLAATPPAPQRLAQGDSAVALEVYLSTTWGSAAMRIEALATWLDQQEENCGLLSIAAADLRAMSAKLYSEPTGEGDSWFADALTSMGEVIPLPTQPPHQDRGEVEQRARELLAEQFTENDTRREALLLGRNIGDPTLRRALRALEQALTQQRGEVSAGDAVFAFSAMLTSLPHVVPFGACAWATPGAELATAFNEANGLSVSRDFPQGLKFPEIAGKLLGIVEKAAAQEGTTPQPSADAVRELVKRWRDRAHEARSKAEGSPAYEVEFSTECGVYVECADELESLLSGGSHA